MDVCRSASAEPFETLEVLETLLDGGDTPTLAEMEEADTPSTPGVRQTDSRQSSIEPEKRPAKKRKSWGQELPTPKTNLPPRKRAKTDDEKEQRRIERVLRNRAAAQSSRERKRKEVEGLEEEREMVKRQNTLLAARLRQAELENRELSQTVANMAAQMTAFRKVLQTGFPTPVDASRGVSPTLSADLIPSKDAVPGRLKEEMPDFDFTLPSAPQPTVDPRDADFSSASGSPKPDPADMADMAEMTEKAADLTQHPAAMLCDLQCQSAASASRSPTSSDERASLIVLMTTSHLLLMTMTSAVSSHLTHPLMELFRSLRTGCPISATMIFSAETLLPLIHWLISTPTNPLSGSAPNRRESSSTLSRRGSRPRPTFRMNLLRRLLACSPALARPLRDATSRALRPKSSVKSSSVRGVMRAAGSGVDETAHVRSLRRMFVAIRFIEWSPGFRSSRPLDPSTEVRRLRLALEPPSASEKLLWRGGR